MMNTRFNLRRSPVLSLLLLLLLLFLSATPSSAQEGPKTHTVQPGETLTGIAEAYGVTVADLVAANDIENPSTIFIGTVLRIPEAGSAAEAAPAVDTAPAIIEDSSYIVQPRDTIDTIAQAFNVDPLAIIAANLSPDDDPGIIFAGQVLVIPANAGPYSNRLPLRIERQEGVGGGTLLEGDELYTVQPGDMLDSIAQALDKAIESIIYANGLEAPYLLAPRQTLIIPGDAPAYGIVPPLPGETTGMPAAIDVGLKDGQGGGVAGTYTVQEGDTLLSIAFDLDIDLVEFLRANASLLNSIEIEPGTELIIP